MIIGPLVYGSAILMNIPMSYLAAQTFERSELPQKDFVTILQGINEYAQVLATIVTVIVFIKNKTNLRPFFNAIVKLNWTFFKIRDFSKDLEAEKWFLWMIILKLISGTLIGGSQIILFYLTFRNRNVLVYGWFWCHCCLILFQQYAVFYFYIAVGFVSKFFKLTNIRLEEIFAEYKSLVSSGKTRYAKMEKCAEICDKIDDLAVYYNLLFEYQKFIKKEYEVQIVSSLLTGFFNNVSDVFASYTLFFGETLDWKTGLYYISVSILGYFDSFLTTCICECNINFSKDAVKVLETFNHLKSLDIRLDRTVRWISFFKFKSFSNNVLPD